MREERAEHDAQRLTAADDAETVVRGDKEHRGTAPEVIRVCGQDAEDEGRQYLEGHLQRGVLQYECLSRVTMVGLLAVEHIAFVGVDGDVLKHSCPVFC